jgi:hypothetical protein
MHGPTWSDILVRGGSTLGLDQAVRLCDRFLLIVEMLQSRGIAHTDLSPANVVFDIARLDVQLVDLEDVYMAGAIQPSAPSRGSRGYQHPGGETCWHADGDRYSSAILAAEILLAADACAMRLATDDYCFGPNTTSTAGAANTRFLRERLRLISGTFASLFDRAWLSSTLAQCPSAAELRQAIQPLKMQLDAGIHWLPREEGLAVPPKGVPGTLPAPTPSPLRPEPHAEVQVMGRVALLVAALILFLIILFAATKAFGTTADVGMRAFSSPHAGRAARLDQRADSASPATWSTAR